MAEAVYILCGLTSVTCMLLLLRAYRGNRVRLLLWTAVCFAGLAINNVLLIVDLLVVRDTDLALIRTLVATGAIGTLLFGLVWDGD